jgi:magnesium transporter
MSAPLVVGIYAMKFEYMPELKWRYGYVGTSASMLAISLAVYFYFRRIKWL